MNIRVMKIEDFDRGACTLDEAFRALVSAVWMIPEKVWNGF